jgi:glycogen(starch) synthase
MRICLLKVAPIADDPRVRKQGDALTAAGHDVHAIGTSGARSEPPSWPVVCVPPPSRSVSAQSRDATRLLVLGRMSAATDRLYWSFREHRDLLAAASQRHADLYLASDWRTLPIAVRAARRAGGSFAYDSHELGVEEFLERPLWRALFPPYVRSIERHCLASAAFVTTVSEGIADILQNAYALRERPTVVRNVPPYEPASFRPTGAEIEVLYHGVFMANRGLEELVASVPLWRPELRLTLRGRGKPAYEKRLRRRVAASPAVTRITLAPPVPMTELVAAARAADVGVHPLLVTSNQMRYSLPNKLFEYIMAGLAVCTTDVPEMAAVIDEYGVGVTVPGPTRDGIATALNGLGAGKIDEAKHRSLAAAKDLCWENESEKFVNLVER